ncbi:MAG: hypothetical protein M1839_007700 [Geoglossum umbratile]|nr:MAG: hypothetical protein M1839_007700 [Geoglossum umbratile]
MADPISLAASIITIVHVADAVLTSCYRFVGKVKSAAADIDRIIHEAGSLKVILLDLCDLADEGGSSLPNLKALAEPNGPLAVCSKALKELEAALAAAIKPLGGPRKLLWPFQSKKVDEILESIRKQKPSLALALATDNIHATRAVQDGVKSIQQSLELTQLRERREKILRWLLWNDPKEKHSTSRRLYQKGSNQWILDSDALKRWKTTPGQSLWLHGIPGCGKTIICSTIVDHIQELCENRLAGRLAYYYFDFSDSKSQKLGSLLRSLIVQLSNQTDVLPQVLETLFDQCDNGRSSPEDESLAAALFSLLDDPALTYIVIDGLDECPFDGDGSERHRLHDLVVGRIGRSPGSFNFLFTSRKERDIEEAMEGVAERAVLHNIPIKSEDVDADVRLHVQQFVHRNKRIRSWSDAVRREIEEAIVSGSRGMFRWAVCQLESIKACALPAAARKLLKQLPRTLNETYDRILKSIPEANESAARAVFMFLAHSLRPLMLEELAEMVVVNTEDQCFSMEERLGDPLADILEICSSLVAVSTAEEQDAEWIRVNKDMEGWYMGRELLIVRFAHFSVKEYIASDRLRETPLSTYYFSESMAHHYITEASLIYLFDFSNGERVIRANFEEYVFLVYATRFWHEHWRKIPPSEEQDCLTRLLQRLFNTDEPNDYINWLNICNPDYREGYHRLRGGWGRSVEHFPSPLYFAAFFGRYGICEWLISNGCDVDSTSGVRVLGDALQAAAYGGYTDIVRLLLRNGASVNAKYGYFGDALQAAAFSGHEEIIRLLLEHGAIVNAEGGEFGYALIAATQQGHFKVAKLLIAHGADPDMLSKRHGKALAGAAASGKMEIVTLLLTRGNDINDTNGTKGSALYSASASGDLSVVRMLLKAGADINLRSGRMNTALQAACNNGHADVVGFLLAKGADVNIRGGEYGDALQACVDDGNPEILSTLLNHGADIDRPGGRYHSALWCAVFRGKTAAAEILLDRGAKFDDEIFLMAVQYRHSTLIDRLLKEGVNVNAQGKDGCALQLAIENNDLNTTLAILQSEDVDVNAKGGKKGGNPLHSALVKGNERVTLELLKRGANANAAGGTYYKPLTAAAGLGHESLVRLLLDKGAYLDGHRGGWRYSPLVEAAGRGYESIVCLLLNRGMDINEYGEMGDKGEKRRKSIPAPAEVVFAILTCIVNALQAAAYYGKMDVVKLLVSRGADINAPEGEEGSALECAIHFAADAWSVRPSGDTNLVHYFLDNGANVESTLDRDIVAQGGHGYGGPLTTALSLQQKELVPLLLDRGADVDGVNHWWNGSSLQRAAESGDEDIVKLLLGRGADVNKNNGTNSALTNALFRCSGLKSKSYHVIVQLLLEAGADVNFQCKGEYTWGCPLGFAIHAGSVPMVEQLIELGADINAPAGSWGTLLGLAISKGDVEISRLLIRHGADINAQVSGYDSALTEAVRCAGEPFVRELLEAGANVDADRGKPLVYACTSGVATLVTMLLDAGADLHCQEGVAGSALMHAAYWAHEDICRLLVERGADVNAVGGEKGNALQASVSNTNTCRSHKVGPVVRYLLAAGADPNLPPSEKYVSALQAAVSNGNGDVVDALVLANANVNAHDPKLGTALVAAAQRSQEPVVQYLLDHGADPYLTGGKYGTALQGASYEHQIEIMNLLLEAGVNPNELAGKYGYALHTACVRGLQSRALEAVALLLKRGADVNARGGKYETALQSAAKHGCLNVVKLLLGNGADANVTGGKYGSAVEAAKVKEHWHVVNFLERCISGKGQ